MTPVTDKRVAEVAQPRASTVETTKDERALPLLQRILADARKNASKFVTEWKAPGGGE
ncbi:MAG: hypothetical protein HZA54_17665 [Planctomycetes bacterium]|nr:hypothetical protein [Planctomycetota bacterium]